MGEELLADLELGLHDIFVGRHRRIARWQLVLRRRVDELVEKDLDMVRRLAVGDLVRLGDVDRERPAQLAGAAFVAVGLALAGVGVEVALHRLGRIEGDQVSVFPVRVRRPLVSFARALGRDPDRWMGSLVGARPEIDVLVAVMLAVECEGAGLGPRPDDQIVRLVKPLVAEGRVGHRCVVFGAEPADETGDEAALGEVVEHREFFGDGDRVVGDRKRPAEHADRRVLHAPGQSAGQQVGRRHHPVGGLVVFVDAHPVEAEPVGKLQLVEIAVVERRALLRVVIAVGKGEVRPRIGLVVVEVEMRVGHQVEKEEFHGAASSAMAVTASRNASVFS